MVLVVKNLPVNAGDIRDAGLIPRLGRSSEGGHGNPLQYSCLENPMERGAWQTTVHRVAKSCPWLNWFSTQAYLYPHPLETPFHPNRHSTHLRHHRALVELPVLYSSFLLAVLHMVVHIRQCYSPMHSRLSFPHPYSVPMSILYNCISIPDLQIAHQCHFSRFHIYVLTYDICFSLWPISLCMTYFTQTLGPSTSLQMTQFWFFNGWVIFHLIYVPQLLYPFVCQWTFSFPPYPSYCK